MTKTKPTKSTIQVRVELIVDAFPQNVVKRSASLLYHLFQSRPPAGWFLSQAKERCDLLCLMLMQPSAEMTILTDERANRIRGWNRIHVQRLHDGLAEPHYVTGEIDTHVLSVAREGLLEPPKRVLVDGNRTVNPCRRVAAEVVVAWNARDDVRSVPLGANRVGVPHPNELSDLPVDLREEYIKQRNAVFDSMLVPFLIALHAGKDVLDRHVVGQYCAECGVTCVRQYNGDFNVESMLAGLNQCLQV